MYDIWLGHSFSQLLFTLGSLSHVYTTALILMPEIKVSPAATTKLGDDGAYMYTAQMPDQVAVSGTFAASGALFSGTWRTPKVSPSTKVTEAGKSMTSFIWHIIGTNGQISVEDDAIPSGLSTSGPKTVIVNGQSVDLSRENAEMSSTARQFAEFAKGDEGVYATFEDALVLHQHIEAIKQSAKEGRRVAVSEMQ
jgi:predicted dehydrogenase